MRLFIFEQVGKKRARVVGALASRGLATVMGVAVASGFALTVDQTHMPLSAVHLASAGIIGGALALVLSLSIIPAQKAAEAFSTAILRLYSRDIAMLFVFLILTFSAMISILLGTTWDTDLDANYSVATQFVLLGVSFDALRFFYVRTLNLLVPQTALALVLRECRHHIKLVSRVTERMLAIYQVAGSPSGDQTQIRAVLFAASQITPGLSAWIAQLDEFAHKAIARRDTLAVNDIISAMQTIGIEYADARRTSIVLMPDWDNLFSAGTTDISRVLEAVHEAIRVVCQDAATHENELVVRHCIRTLGLMTTHAMTLVYAPKGAGRTTPLAYSPSFYVGLCIEMAIKAKMADAVYQSIDVLSSVISAIEKGVETSAVATKVREILFKIAIAGYNDPLAISCHPAMAAILLAAKHDIEIRGYQSQLVLTEVLTSAEMLVPFEVAMEKAGKRIMQTYPPYSLAFSANIPALLEQVAHQVEPIDPKRRWINPFREFCEASENIIHHYGNLAKIDFQNTLLRKWVVDSMITCAQVHIALLDHPQEGADRFLGEVEKRLRWFVHTVVCFFPAKDTFHNVNDAADALSMLGMGLLDRGRMEPAKACAVVIATLATNYAASRAEPYGFAELWVNLEALARAADALGHPAVAADYRKMIARPAAISDENWPHFREAIATRIDQFNRSLGEVGRQYRIYGEPASVLRAILDGAKRAQKQAPTM